MFEINRTETAAFDTSTLETITFEIGDDHVATITLNRPDRLNSFNQDMLDDFASVWAHVRANDAIHAVVLQAAGERAFCTGVDVKDGYDRPPNIWTEDDPGIHLGPKASKVWKPLVCAVHGMAAGGAFYWINEADIVICSEDATFFDPHVSFGMVAALEPIGLARRIPLGDVMRMALLGVDERMSATRALQIGLVTEVVARDALRPRAHELAALIAAKPPAAVQGTVRAVWESLDLTRSQALDRGLAYTLIGNPIGVEEIDRANVSRPEPRIR
jgi:enoyl-CoA hydratase/carnithine racemase